MKSKKVYIIDFEHKGLLSTTLLANKGDEQGMKLIKEILNKNTILREVDYAF